MPASADVRPAPAGGHPVRAGGGQRHESGADPRRADDAGGRRQLNVSRPHLMKLLETGALPFHKAGKQRRVRFANLMPALDATQRDRSTEFRLHCDRRSLHLELFSRTPIRTPQ